MLEDIGRLQEWHRFLDLVLHGRIRDTWTDYGRRISYLPDRYLIKTIRSNLMLGYILSRFDTNIIYMLRNPCGVVYSRMQKGWTPNIATLISQSRLISDYLSPWFLILNIFVHQEGGETE